MLLQGTGSCPNTDEETDSFVYLYFPVPYFWLFSDFASIALIMTYREHLVVPLLSLDEYTL